MQYTGYYFVNWCLKSVHKLIDAMSGVWSFMVMPIDWPDSILGIPIDQTIEIVPIDIMFFGGITGYLIFILIKFVFDIVL